ncbi:DUF6504 family protein [Nocardiopsis mangrovi]|uniref:DUF6504 family protein n=1 Tax=Nocardiopsis mangrovi TaxID=1179818 RepID=A0ABV9DR13_9ACTN
MGRIFGVQITVAEQDGRPVRFTWQGRIYAVRRIIDHWVTLRADWAPHAEDRLPQRTYWRVEAGSQEVSRGVYELRHDSLTGSWTLARVWD